MLNKIWFWLLAIGIVYGFGKAAVEELRGVPPAGQAVVENDDLPVIAAPFEQTAPPEVEESVGAFQRQGEALTNAALEAANLAVEICLALIGVMVLWLGLLNIAKDAGLVDALARALAPVMRWLFPDVPEGHPAHGAMLMNISANMLGLDNAATPFGLKAMHELQTLNPTKDTATDAMAMFLAINTSNVTLIPIAIIALRVAAKSEQPTLPLAGMILTTAVATIVAVVAARVFSRQARYAMPLVESPGPVSSTASTDDG